MNGLVVLIPFKSTNPKSRLAGVLSASQRRELSEKMLEDVLDAVSGAGLAGSCFVVTSSGNGARIAGRKGAGVVPEKGDLGVNSAVLEGMAAAGESGEFLVLPSDLPAVDASDIARIRSLKSSGLGVVISPSGKLDGTNALLFDGQRHPELSYDRDSFWRHIEGSARLALKVATYNGSGVTFDVDSPQDLSALIREDGDGAAREFARRALK